MEEQEILVRTEIYLQKVSEGIDNTEDKKTLKRAMEIIENLLLKEWIIWKSGRQS